MDRFRKAVTLLAALALLPAAVQANDNDSPEPPTFTKDVLPILQANCQACHRPNVTSGGSTAPMTLLSYAEARPWAKSIARAVTNREMPPWHAAPRFHGVFENERVLTDEEIATIQRWAASGAPHGDPADAPEPVVFPDSQWQIADPDLIVKMPEPFTVQDDVEDLYQNFVVEITEEMLPEPRWIKAMEFLPGSEVVHHIIGYAIEPAGEDGRPGRKMLGGIAPGNEPDVFPEGYGKLLAPGTKLVFAMHYHKEPGPGTAIADQSMVGFKFYDDPELVQHELKTEAIGNTHFEIPPGHPNWEVGSAKVFTEDTAVVSLMPHMHLRGKDATYTAFYPDGSKEVLLEVPEYDFNWQLGYLFAEPKMIPAGTRIEVAMHFDNSNDNESNPDPDQAIRFGGPTTDEMMLGWLDYTPATPRQELAKSE